MKKIIALVLSIIMVCSLAGCSDGGFDSGEELLVEYIKAVKAKDYEAIWDMLPEEIQDYAINEDIIDDKEDGIRFIKKATKNYDWLVKWSEAEGDDFEIDIIDVESHDGVDEDTAEYFEEIGLEMEYDSIEFYTFVLTTEEGEEIENFFLAIEIDSKWYIASVAGDDEIFVY